MLAKNKSIIKKDGDPKPKKRKLRGGDAESGQYGLYSGVVDEEGKTDNNPDEEKSVKTMVAYMKNNNPPQSSNPSNVYRPQFSHITKVYNRKKKQDIA